MRKVKFKTWIPATRTPSPSGSGTTVLAGTNCWQPDFENEGVFHTWGVAYEEGDTGFGNYTVAIVELPNGEVVTPLPSNIKFLD